MYEFCFVYLQPKYSEKSKLSYMDTERFIIYIKTDDICKNIGEMLKLDLILQITNHRDHCLKEKIKNYLD